MVDIFNVETLFAAVIRQGLNIFTARAVRTDVRKCNTLAVEITKHGRNRNSVFFLRGNTRGLASADDEQARRSVFAKEQNECHGVGAPVPPNTVMFAAVTWCGPPCGDSAVRGFGRVPNGQFPRVRMCARAHVCARTSRTRVIP